MSTSDNKIKSILIGVFALFIFVTLVVLAILSRHVTMNPPGTIGNTAGNINNEGLFCEYEDTVYFSNPYDSGSLYAMNADESNIRKLTSSNVCNILAGGKYLYYFQRGAHSDGGFENLRTVKSFNRCDLKGKNATGITRDVVVSGQLIDNYLYLMTSTTEGPSFYKIRIDKKDKTVFEGLNINPACAANGTFYYNGNGTNHYLHAWDTATDNTYEVWRGNLWYPVLEGDYVYYLDVAKNYRLCRYSMTEKYVEVLCSDRVDCFNVGSGYIYYQTNSDTPQLRCMRTDGSENMPVANGYYTHINMTSEYVYFQVYGEEDAMYHCPVGQTMYSVFDGAEMAVAK